MRCVCAKINWIAERSFAVEIDCGSRKVAVEFPIEMLTPDMVEGQRITIQIDEGDRRVDT